MCYRLTHSLTHSRLKRRCQPSEMHPLHAVLDQGLQIFAIKNKPREMPPEVLDKISKLENRVDKLLGMNKGLQAEMSSFHPSSDIINLKEYKKEAYSDAIIEDVQNNSIVKMVGSIESHHAMLRKDKSSKKDGGEEKEGEGERKEGEGEGEEEGRDVLTAPLTMACKHYVKWEHQIDFENWCKDMDAEMKK